MSLSLLVNVPALRVVVLLRWVVMVSLQMMRVLSEP